MNATCVLVLCAVSCLAACPNPLRPQKQLATNVGEVYPAGTIVGYSGGDTADTGLGQYSTGSHLCVQTLGACRSAFPTGKDPCE